MEPILAILWICIFFYILFLIFKWVGDMAKRRGRNPWAWWIVSLAWSPFGSMIVLWLFFPIGEDPDLHSEG